VDSEKDLAEDNCLKKELFSAAERLYI